MISEPLLEKSAHVVEKLLDEMLPRESVDFNLPRARWRRVKTTVACPVPIWAAQEYDGVVMDLIHQIKFQGRTDLVDQFSWGGLSFAAQPVFVPVPQSRRSFVARGYNQSLLIAQQLARDYDGRVIDLLYRAGSAQYQHFNHLHERLAQENQFCIKDGSGWAISNNLVVVDDVVTSGATLSDCVTVLRVAGSTVLAAVVIAATPKKIV